MTYRSFLTRSRHHTNWYARIVIPHDIRAFYGNKREVRKTLKTPCKMAARRRAMSLWLVYQHIFDQLRSGQAVACLKPAWGQSDQPLLDVVQQDSSIDAIASSAVMSPTVSPAQPDQASPQHPAATPLYSESSITTPSMSDAETVSKLFDEFLEERLSDARKKTQITLRQHVGVFIELMGDIPASQLSKPVVREFIKQLKTYPSHRNHGRWKNMSLAKVKASGKQPISATTQHNILGNLHGYASWLVEIDVLQTNPFSIRRKAKKKAPSKERTWSRAELSRWFQDELYLKHRGSSQEAWKFWLPLMAIYTGARLEELAALSPVDFVQHQGIHAFRIHGEDGRHVKNLGSWRYVPLHSALLDAGLLSYVASRDGCSRLFTLKPFEGQYGKNASKAFGYIRRKLGIEPDFHGYRHTVIEALKIKGGSITHIQWLVGHSEGSQTGEYGSTVELLGRLKPLKELVELLDWHGCIQR